MEGHKRDEHQSLELVNHPGLTSVHHRDIWILGQRSMIKAGMFKEKKRPQSAVKMLEFAEDQI